MILKWRKYFKNLYQYVLPLPLSRFSMFMGFLQIYYLYEVFATNDTGGLSFTVNSVFLVLWSVFTVILSFQILTRLSCRRWVTLTLCTFGLTVYTIVAAYHFGANDLLNWNVIAENISIAFSPEAANVIFHSLDIRSLQYGLYIFIIFAYFEFRFKTVSKITPAPLLLSHRISAFLIYLLLFFLPIDALDPLLNFTRSGYFYLRNEHALNIKIEPNTYPLIQSFESSITPKFNERFPTIFLIVVESLNANVINQYSSTGKPLTPFLNQLSKKSVTVSPFYGNSIQTAKGHFATFFSTIPALNGKTFVKYPDVKIQSIATLLKPYNYQSIVFAAHKNRDFDNTSSFLLSNGYDEYEIVKPYLSDLDIKNKLRWGVKDEVFFNRFFNYYDKLPKTDSPKFFTLLTIANHFPFNSMKDTDRLIYPEPSSIQEDYANSIRLVDDGIKAFYDGLIERGLYENSLVIITGDHAFPLGLHGNYHLEAGYHEDSFRIPFFMTWPNRMTPKELNKAASQMDIGPTILDLLSLSIDKTHFQGKSIFNDSNSPIFLVQPYAKHFSIIRYPIKYRFFAKTEQEFVYNLEKDPLEQTSILTEIQPELLKQFRIDLKKMYMTHALILNDQLIP